MDIDEILTMEALSRMRSYLNTALSSVLIVMSILSM